MPASAMVSDICSSIGAPWVEMSSAIHQVCRRIGIAERIAITMIVTAKNFPMISSPCARLSCGFLRTPQSRPWSHGGFQLNPVFSLSLEREIGSGGLARQPP